MDAAVLAGGRGARLQGLAAPFHKPLLVFDGHPLVLRAVRLAQAVSERVFVIAAAANAGAIVQLLDQATVLDRRTFVLVEAEPRGTGPSLAMALRLSDSSSVFVALADTVMTADEESKLQRAVAALDVERPRHVVTVTRVHSPEEAGRFALVPETSGVLARDSLEAFRWRDGDFRACIGPLILPRADILLSIEHRSHGATDEVAIRNLRDLGRPEELIEVQCFDAGIVAKWRTVH